MKTAARLLRNAALLGLVVLTPYAAPHSGSGWWYLPLLALSGVLAGILVCAGIIAAVVIGGDRLRIANMPRPLRPALRHGYAVVLVVALAAVAIVSVDRAQNLHGIGQTAWFVLSCVVTVLCGLDFVSDLRSERHGRASQPLSDVAAAESGEPDGE